MAEPSRLEFEGIEVPVEGKIEKLDSGFKFTRVIVRPLVTIHNEQDRERVERVLEKAEQVCLVSRFLDCGMVLEPKIVVEYLVHQGLEVAQLRLPSPLSHKAAQCSPRWPLQAYLRGGNRPRGAQ